MSASLEERVLTSLGESGFESLVASFYRRVAEDPLLRPMYPEADLAPAEERLRDFLLFRFGGSQRYLEERGHPRLRMRHAPFAVDRAARDAWMDNMNAALEETVPDESIRSELGDFLGQVADFLMNRAG